MRFQLSKNSQKTDIKNPSCYYPGSIASGLNQGTYSRGRYQSNQKNLDVQFSAFERNSQQQQLNCNNTLQHMSRSGSFNNICETTQSQLQEQLIQNNMGHIQTGTQNLYPALNAYQYQTNPLDCNCYYPQQMAGQDFYAIDKNRDGRIDAYELAEAERKRQMMSQSLYTNSLNTNANYIQQNRPVSPVPVINPIIQNNTVPVAHVVQQEHSSSHQSVQTNTNYIHQNRPASPIPVINPNINIQSHPIINPIIQNNVVPVPHVVQQGHSSSHQTVQTNLVQNSSLLDRNRDGRVDAFELAEAERRLRSQSPVLHSHANIIIPCQPVTERHVTVENREEHSVKDHSSYSKISHNCSEVTIQK